MMMITSTPSSSCRFPVPARPACDSPPAPATLHLQHRSCVGIGTSGNPLLPWRSHRSLRLLRPAVQSSQSQAAVAEAAADTSTCVWGDLFVTYTPSPSQRSEEWMRERANELKGQVRRMFVTSKDMSVADMLSLVDTLKRLGIDNHFRQEIDVALSRIHSEEQDYFDDCSDLHVVALGFCILRQHGFWVSTDVFNKFRDATGNFGMDLTADTRGLLSLYNAAHMAVPGEVVLDDAIAFARRHLEDAKGKLRSPMVEQVSRALEIPRPRFMPRLEAMHYITEYEKEEAHSTTILVLAKIDFNIVRSLYIKELNNLSLWWKPLYSDVNLTYTRNRIVESHFYGSGMLPEENSRGRIIFTKFLAIVTLVDDTYDTEATLEQCQIFTEAIERWDENVVPILPEYLRMLYNKLLRNIKETEDIFWNHGRRAALLIFKNRYSYLLSDVHHKPRSSKKDMASSFECYMKEHGVTPEDAKPALATMVEHAWRINKAYMELDRGILPAAQVAVNMARMNQILYIHGRDAFSFGDTLKDTIASLLLKDFPI